MNQAGSWDEDIITDLFEPSDVSRILATPISPDSHDVWRWQDSSISHNDGLIQLVNGCLCSPTVKETIYVAAKLWLIWSVRNDVIWKGKALSIANLLNHAARLCDLWFSVYSRGDNSAGGNSNEAVWIPPPPGRIKCNVDAALYGDDVGFGLCPQKVTDDSNGDEAFVLNQ
nr:uncharacterized protein LOC109176732 [Ipomoea trifida]